MATTTVNVDLKKNGFLVTRYPLVSAPGGEQPYQLNLTHLAEHREGEYSLNNSIVCWVMDGEIYAAPYTRKTNAAAQPSWVQKWVVLRSVLKRRTPVS